MMNQTAPSDVQHRSGPFALRLAVEAAPSVPLRAWLVLGKYRIATLAALSAATGYLLAAGRVDVALFAAVAGTGFLAAAAGALNQAQETDVDARMRRTCRRPLPMRLISIPSALLFAALAGAAGTVLLLVSGGWAAAALGLLALGSYNLLYTPLKRVTPWAAIPGSIVGALPPAIGWAAAGRSVGEGPILAVSAYFFLWQIPHFWLLLLYFAQDFERSGLPCLTRTLGPRRLAAATFAGIVLTALMAGGGLMLAGAATGPLPGALLAGVSLWLLWRSRGLLHRAAPDATAVRGAFIGINLYALFVMMILTAAALW
ncbi:MAG: hypothetical protein Kow0059_20240 [Candidatus Sumerlaeia bacterium]